jgi:hypothetical protein
MPVSYQDAEPPSRKRPELKFRWIQGQFAICRLACGDPVPEWATKGMFTSITRTSDELSIVCPLENVPEQFKPEIPWICFKLEGPFAFSQTGILHAFIVPLAENGVPIFAIATFDTDYVLIQESFMGVALNSLQGAGHEIVPKDESWRKLIE